MQSDNELKKVFQVFIDDEGIVNLVYFKEERDPKANTRIAQLVEEDILNIFKKNPKKKFCCFINLLPVPKGGYFTNEARRIYINLGSHYQVNKVAVAGGSVFTKTAAIFILSVSGKGGTTRWFKTKKEAISWLLEND